MISNPTEHPGANFILKAFSASINASSLEGDNYFIVVDNQSTANSVELFLTEKKISFEHEDTQFLIDLASISESFVKPSKKKLTGLTKFEKFMDALRLEGATPVPFSKRALLKGQVFVNTTNGNKKRFDFFDEHQASIVVPNLRELGFFIEKGECKDVRCYIVDLDKSLETTGVVVEEKKQTMETPVPVISFTKKYFIPWLADNKLPAISSFGMEGGKRAYYFQNTADRDLVLQKLKEIFPTVTFTGTGARTILITDLINKSTRKVVPVVKTKDVEMPSDTMTCKEINKALKKCKAKKKSSTYFEAGTVPGINYDTRPYYMKTPKDREKFFEYLKKNHPHVVITKYKEIGILIKSSGKTYIKKPKTVQSEKVIPVKTSQVELVTTDLHEDLKQLAQKHGLLPKMEQPAGILIPDSIGSEIVLPHEALLKTGADGVTISTEALREFFKNK